MIRKPTSPAETSGGEPASATPQSARSGGVDLRSGQGDLTVHARDIVGRDKIEFHIGVFGEDPGSLATPSCPPSIIHFVERKQESTVLRRAILRTRRGDNPAVTGLRGLPGVGKTALATAVFDDPDVAKAFPDGRIWVTVGWDPGTLTRQMATIGRAFGDRPERYATPEDGVNRLRQVLSDRAALIVLDDVWQLAHLRPFCGLGKKCHILFTTRDGGLAPAVGAAEVHLRPLRASQAVALLRSWAGRTEAEFPQIAAQLGHLPLAIKIAGVRLREGISGRDWLQTFVKISQVRLGYAARGSDENLRACFDLSVQMLNPLDQPLYFSLGIFPADTPVANRVVERLWRTLRSDLASEEAAELLNYLRRIELIESSDRDVVRFHDLLQAYAAEGLADHAATHRALLAAYNPGNEPWSVVPDDGYLYGQLTYHLNAALNRNAILDLLRETSSDDRNGWYTARSRAGQTLGYLNDLRRAFDALDEEGRTAVAENRRATTLATGTLLAMCQSSVFSLRADLPVAVMIALVDRGIWSVDHALVQIRQVEQADERLLALRLLASHANDSRVASQILLEAFDTWKNCESGRGLEGREQLAKALATARLFDRAVALATDGPNEYLTEATLKAVTPLANDDASVSAVRKAAEGLGIKARSRVLVMLAERTPDREQELIELVREAYREDPFMHAGWVSDVLPLVTHLRGDGKQHFTDWIIDEFIASGESDRIPEAAVLLAPHLSQSQARRVLYQLKSLRSYAILPHLVHGAFLALARQLEPGERDRELDELLEVVRRSRDLGDFGYDLVVIAAIAAVRPDRSKDLYEEVLQRVKSTRYHRAGILRAILKDVPDDLLSNVAEVIASLKDVGEAVKLWDEYLAARGSILVRAAQTAAAGYEPSYRARVLAAAVTAAPDNERCQLLFELLAELAPAELIDEELDVLKRLAPFADISVPSTRYLEKLLGCSWIARVPGLLRHLARIAPAVTRVALADAVFRSDDLDLRRNILSSMAPNLTPDELRSILVKSGRINDATRRECVGSAVTAWVAEVLPGSESGGMIHKADSLVQVFWRAARLLDEIESTHNSTWDWRRVGRCQLRIARRLAELGSPDLAVEVAKKVSWSDEYDHRGMGEVARLLPHDSIEALIQPLLQIPNPSIRAECVSSVVQNLPERRVTEFATLFESAITKDCEGTIRGWDLIPVLPCYTPARRDALVAEAVEYFVARDARLPLAPLSLLSPWLSADQAEVVLTRLKEDLVQKDAHENLYIVYALPLVAAMWPREDLLNDLMRRAQLVDKPERARLLASVSRSFRDTTLRTRLLDEAAFAARALSENGLRGNALVDVALEVDDDSRAPLLLDAFRAGLAEESRDYRTVVLVLSTALLTLGPAAVAYEAWESALRSAFTTHRPECVNDLSDLRLLPYALGGSEQTVAIVNVMDQVGRWWP